MNVKVSNIDPDVFMAGDLEVIIRCSEEQVDLVLTALDRAMERGELTPSALTIPAR